jgi:hypothetical protein
LSPWSASRENCAIQPAKSPMSRVFVRRDE